MRNRLYRADCKAAIDRLLREDVRVDLIYLDPPFNSNRTYSILFHRNGVSAQQKAYHDMWDFTDSTRQLVLDFKEELNKWEFDEPFKEFIRAWIAILDQGGSQDRKMLNYLMYMTQRLVGLKKLLKPEGSIYLHCNPEASHYLKVIMDGIFGRINFQNEFIWHHPGGGSPKVRWAWKHDVILFYSNSKKWTFNVDSVRLPHKWDKGQKRADGSERDKRGKLPDDVWRHHQIMPWAKEYRGLETQKPLALLDRILKASSNEGSLVLDPFCGCGTTIEAAHKLKRRWIGIDISGPAVDEIQDRLKEQGLYPEKHYDIFEGSPETMDEYNRLTAFEKQDWLIRRLNGLPNPRKSGDRGVDGDLDIHLGVDEAGRDRWGRVIFSVKTGKQRKPEHVRELIGTMRSERAQIGVLILDVEPTEKMEEAAKRAKAFHYQQNADLPPKEYDGVQILTAFEIIEGAKIDHPPTLQAVKRFREAQTEMKV